jgi:hypothetical protein
MPITQTPTISILNKSKNEFLISFSVACGQGDSFNPSIVLPNGIGFSGSAYTINFLNINSPVAANLPQIRTLQFNIAASMFGVPVSLANIYIVNPATQQMVSLYPSGPPDPDHSSVITGSVPFYCNANQVINIYVSNLGSPSAPPTDNVNYNMSFSALTFDAGAYLYQAGYELNSTLNDNSGVSVTIEGPTPLPVVITGQPIEVTTTP